MGLVPHPPRRHALAAHGASPPHRPARSLHRDRHTRSHRCRPHPRPRPATQARPHRPPADRRRDHPRPGRCTRPPPPTPPRCCRDRASPRATATTGEIPRVHWRDLDLHHRTVRLPGAPPIRPRHAALTDWGAAALARWHHAGLIDRSPSSPVLSSRTAGIRTHHAAQAAAANLITKILHAAGLDHPDIRPSSLRLWGAEQARAADGIEAAARALGIDSLDATADALELRWQDRP
ncbi:MAG: hypothetical protein U5R31_07555 [Acidimicrobiia bacterium]|nr:hypothetical protein [Acidimicrobiia bacterium]